MTKLATKPESGMPLLEYSEDDLCRWIAHHTSESPSDAVMRCVGLLARWLGGTHHIEDFFSVKKVNWVDPLMFTACCRGSLSTFDFDKLTQLVFLAHDLLIRVELTGASNGYIRFRLHPRMNRKGDMFQRHPTIEQAIDRWRLLG